MKLPVAASCVKQRTLASDGGRKKGSTCDESCLCVREPIICKLLSLASTFFSPPSISSARMELEEMSRGEQVLPPTGLQTEAIRLQQIFFPKKASFLSTLQNLLFIVYGAKMHIVDSFVRSCIGVAKQQDKGPNKFRIKLQF